VAVTAEHVRAALDNLRRHFGYVVIDLPHGFSEVTLAALELADRILLVATPEPAVLRDVRECRRIFHDALHLPGDRIAYILNHPLPYASLGDSDFVAATAAAWTEVAFGGEAPTAAALRGESLLSSRPNNPVARTAAALADEITSRARDAALLAGRSL
jgi:Flp pilus assembly CpaE family ATPase